MTDADALALIERYKVSWYNDVDHINPDRICHPDDAPPRMVPAHELVVSMRENIDEAIFNRDGIRRRYEQAQRDGLFDIAALKTIKDDDIREAWIMAIDTQRGDKGRCIAELKHWRSYLGLAMRGSLPTQIKPAPEPDTRLPPEQEEATDGE